VRRQGVRIIYGAMWDEYVNIHHLSEVLTRFTLRYDEGTALMPAVEKKRMLPVSDKYPFMALDEDGFDLPSDWLVGMNGSIEHAN
jgi:hypothetical protein